MVLNITSIKSNFTTYTLKLTFLFVNLIFIYKYGLRQNLIPVHFALLIYTLIYSFLFYKDILEFKFIKSFISKYSYIFVTLLVASIIFSITIFTDANSLKVDRWSALDVTIRALLNGEYPYSHKDHLDNISSNFPGLTVIGIPFFLLGNVGYIQTFAFLLLSYTLYKSLELKNSFRYLLFLLISPAYWWEIFAISDLMSNSIMVFCFIVLLKQKLKNNIFKHPVFLGFSTSLLTLTRGVFIIPLVLLVFKDYWETNLNSKVKYTLTFLATAILLITIVLINCPDLETLKAFNPYSRQIRLLPRYIHILSIALPFYYSFKTTEFEKDFFKTTAFLILFPTILAFIYVWIDFGFEILIAESKFDLSYLSIATPFILKIITKKESAIQPSL